MNAVSNALTTTGSEDGSARCPYRTVATELASKDVQGVGVEVRVDTLEVESSAFQVGNVLFHDAVGQVQVGAKRIDPSTPQVIHCGSVSNQDTVDEDPRPTCQRRACHVSGQYAHRGGPGLGRRL